jgi:hypothetical protein
MPALGQHYAILNDHARLTVENAMMRSATGQPLRPVHVAMLTVTIVFQLALAWFLNAQTSFFVADDIIAIELAHQVDFLAYVQTPVDVHRVPLHRAVNYAVHHLLPMNFAAATTLQLGCHALTLLVLHRLLQRVGASTLGPWLVAAYALNAYAIMPLHWWSAALHRYPFALAAVVSCYAFVRLHQTHRLRFAFIALLGAVAGCGFYIKGVLIPLCWAALMFCLMNFRDWRCYLRQYLLIAAGTACSIAYVLWYLRINTHTVIDAGNSAEVIRVGLQWGLSAVAQAPLQMPLKLELAPWINAAWLALLAGIAMAVRGAWRAIVMALLLVIANLLMICASSRTSQLGPLMMLSPRYYFDVLFVLVIFAGLMCRGMHLPAMITATWQRTALACARWPHAGVLALAFVLVLYAAAGWRTVLNHVNSPQAEIHVQAARYEHNLRLFFDAFGDEKLNLADTAVPRFFLYDEIQSKPLPLSTYLAWHGWHPSFDAPDRPLFRVDDNGKLQPVVQEEDSHAQ